MPIKVSCACGKKLSVKDEFAGKSFKCPACQKPLRVPKPKAEEEPAEDEWDLGDSAEEDCEDEPAKSRGRKSSVSRGATSRKSSSKGKVKKSKSSNRGLLIGLSAGAGVFVVALAAWLLWPVAPDAFDHKAYEIAKPKLDALKMNIPHQLITRREDLPETFPDGVSSAVLLSLPKFGGFDLYPDNLWTPLRSISHLHVIVPETGDARLQQLTEHPGLIGLGFRKPCTVSVTDLARLKKCPHLRSFSLNEVPITPELVKTIGELSELRSLSINETPVTGSMVESLLSLKNLVGLSLKNTGLTDAEAAQIAKLSKLQTLFLDQTKITDQGLQSLKTLSGLTFLGVRGLSVSPQAVDDLQKDLPNCKILK